MEIEDAKKEVNKLFKDLMPIVDEVVDKYSKELDTIMKKIDNNREMSNENLREYIIGLSIEAYYFGMYKDSSILKQECAETLLKEKMAKSYNSTEGTQIYRNNQSYVDAIDKQVISLVFNAVSNMMKTKLDETHRMINALNSILISRNAEAKLAVGNLNTEEEHRKTILNEEV